MLTGKAKTEYQRDYMRKRRLKAKNTGAALSSPKQGLENAPESTRMAERQPVRPNVSVRPKLDPETVRPELDLTPGEIKQAEQGLENMGFHRCEPVIPYVSVGHVGGCRECRELTYQYSKGFSCPVGEWSTAVRSIFEQNINPDCDCRLAGSRSQPAASAIT